MRRTLATLEEQYGLTAVPLADLTVKTTIQIRAFPIGSGQNPVVNLDAVNRYKEAYSEGSDLGPIVVVRLSTNKLLLADGFHRRQALLDLGQDEADVIVIPGTEADAVMIACELNSMHGLALGPEDRRKAAKAYIEASSEKGLQLNDTQIAGLLGISRQTVGRARADLDERFQLEVRPVTRNGVEYEMKKPSKKARLDDTPLPNTAEPDPLLDRDDDPIAYMDAPPALQPSRALPRHNGVAPSAPAGRRVMELMELDQEDERAVLPSVPPSPGAVAFTLGWTYVDGSGEVHGGWTLGDALDTVPPPVMIELRKRLEDW